MKTRARVLSIIPAIAAAVLLASVVMSGAHTVLGLRSLGQREWPLVAPINAIPATLILLSVWAFARDRNGIAATLGVAAFAVASLFWISQASGSLG